MSLNPTWFSTVFGVYYFARQLRRRRCRCWRSSPSAARGKDVFGGYMNDEHTHNIGKLMLAFICFWTYIAFSQLHADLDRGPARGDAVLHHALQARAGAWIGVVLIFGHFFIPFGALLSRSLKRNPQQLAVVARLDPLHPLRRHLLAGDADR